MTRSKVAGPVNPVANHILSNGVWLPVSSANPLPIEPTNITSASGLSIPANYDYRLAHAIEQIYSDYSDTVLIKPKQLRKFGKNQNLSLDTLATVWVTGGDSGQQNEAYPTDNTIDRISSSNGTDTQSVVIEGHTLSGSNLTFVTQTATLDGQNQVILTTPLYRATRLYNNGSSNFSGKVYVYESGGTVTNGVPQDTTKIHITVLSSDNQSFKTSTSLSSVDYWLITQFYAVVDEKTSASVDFEVEIREFGKVFRKQLPGSASSTGASVNLALDPILIVPKNSDVRVTAIASANNTAVEAFLSGYLALVQ